MASKSYEEWGRLQRRFPTPLRLAARYAEEGAADRSEYLVNLASELGAPEEAVFTLADLYGPDEDFDGLVTDLEDRDGLWGDEWGEEA